MEIRALQWQETAGDSRMESTSGAIVTSAQSNPNDTHRLTPDALARHVEGWIADGQYRMLSKQSLATRRLVAEKLLWWLRRERIALVDTSALRGFLAYLVTGHEAEGGRWENEANSHRHRKARPATVRTYFDLLRVLFNFLAEERVTPVSLMAGLTPPRVPQDQIQPFSESQVKALLVAAAKSNQPRRNTALILFLLDTGCRAGEAVTLKMRDLDLTEGYALVIGKGASDFIALPS
jgi:integrase